MRTGELVKGKVGLGGRETPRPQWLTQQKFLMLIKGEAGLHRVVQGPRVAQLCCLYPEHHHPACRPGRERGGLSWLFCGSVLEVAYITVSVGLDEATQPWLTSRETGGAVQLCAQEEGTWVWRTVSHLCPIQELQIPLDPG